jgi:hypothetical protein
VFKLSWLLPTALAGLALFWLLSTSFINVPSRLQQTHGELIRAHDGIRTECVRHLANLQFDDAYTTISRREKTAELVAQRKLAEAGQKSSLYKVLNPLLNSILFQTGVAVTFVPALLRLLLLLVRIKLRARGAPGDAREQARWDEGVRREWGVFLPIMNVVTLISVCVAPAFYFWIEPGRAQRCMYSSGHWYTFTCTCLTFAIVITHLYRNREYCKSSMTLLT